MNRYQHSSASYTLAAITADFSLFTFCPTGRALGKSDLPRNTLQMQNALNTLLSKTQ
jgi:hypothetical protein